MRVPNGARRLLAAPLLIFVVASTLIAWLAGPAGAACDPYRINGSFTNPLFAGEFGGLPAGDTFVGDAATTISFNTPYVDFVGADDAAVYEWPMIHRQNCGKYGFAQVGFAENSEVGGQTAFFSEEETCTGNPYHGPMIIPGNPYGVAHSFEVQHNNGCAWNVRIDGVVQRSGNDCTWNGNQVQFFSETHSQDDQNYGGYNSNAQQHFTQIRGCYGHAGAAQDCSTPDPDYDYNSQYKYAYNYQAQENVYVNWMDLYQSNWDNFAVWDAGCASS